MQQKNAWDKMTGSDFLSFSLRGYLYIQGYSLELVKSSDGRVYVDGPAWLHENKVLIFNINQSYKPI